MFWVAWRMLIGNRSKYGAMVFGITFASMLICQQCSIFCGVIRMCTGQIRDVEDAPIWVLAPETRYIDDLQSLPDRRLDEVRSVSGVGWAAPLRKGYGRVDLADGHFQQVMLFGLDDATLAGAPRTLLAGSLADLQQPDAVVMDDLGYDLLWPDEPRRVGREFTLNGRRAVLVAICQVSLTFQTLPVLYARRSQAAQFLPPESRTISAILVGVRPGQSPDAVCRQIRASTGLDALTRDQWIDRTTEHYLRRTGLLLNFGTTVLLGLLVGVAIAGQSFYTFTVENLPQFGMLRAMGATDRRLVGMVLLQAGIVGAIGYGIGVGLAAAYGELTRDHSMLVFYMPWQVPVLTGAAVLAVTAGTSLVSIRRVLSTEPALVVR